MIEKPKGISIRKTTSQPLVEAVGLSSYRLGQSYAESMTPIEVATSFMVFPERLVFCCRWRRVQALNH